MRHMMASALYEKLEKISDHLDMQIHVSKVVGCSNIALPVEDAEELLYMVNKRLYDMDRRKAMRVKK